MSKRIRRSVEFDHDDLQILKVYAIHKGDNVQAMIEAEVKKLVARITRANERSKTPKA
jgi:hypothetical protein